MVLLLPSDRLLLCFAVGVGGAPALEIPFHSKPMATSIGTRTIPPCDFPMVGLSECSWSSRTSPILARIDATAAPRGNLARVGEEEG